MTDAPALLASDADRDRTIMVLREHTAVGRLTLAEFIDRLPHLSARVHEHSDLLAAIRDGDAERARTIAGDHVITFEQEIRSVL